MPPNTSIRSTHEDLVEESLIKSTPYFDIEVSSSALFEGAFKVVQKVFPNWKYQDIKFVQCKDGITNQLVRVTYEPTDFSLLVRAYGKGSELIIDRKQEVVNIITLSAQGMCPPLYARFKNGLVYGFIKGKVSTVEELGQERTAEWIAKKLARWHQVNLPQDFKSNTKKQTLWSTMFKWLEQVPEKYENPQIQSTFEAQFNIKEIRSELEMLIQKLNQVNSPIVFSHNDLLYGNIIYDEEKQEANFIDYEYGCYAFRGFDIGNHFNEFAGFECEYWRYPTKEFQMKWYDWYLTEFNKGVRPSEQDKEQLFKEVNGFSLASHFYWGLWAMIQAKISDIDFNYMDYAVLRFNEYHKRKQQVLTSLEQ
ncbi:kinase-like domain-containing protein [Gilbertella persicaria]|uniref:kinase-like domain-containing protein n=1 Tax=Gilbertella persicaria TaxID=101096 RepID=UPI00221F9DF9|nr:kinase-like domain-containing protein [Gilbertella persicaria]KAI8078200.1 kinase-like domain-containing protein [Gilbertella persicaria]